MYLQAVCIDHLGTTAHRREIEPRFSFFDEVLHLAPATVKLNDLIWSCFHRCDDKGIQMDHLVIGFLNLKDNPFSDEANCRPDIQTRRIPQRNQPGFHE